MKITNLYGLSYESTALIAQNMVEEIAETLGFKELGIYRYDVSTDSPEMLRTRLDGVFASVQFNDTIVYQLPTWNGIPFDEEIVRKGFIYGDSKKIIFVHDVIPFMWEDNLEWIYSVVRIFNLADVLILPSRNMEKRLRKYGLTTKKIIYQEMWDYTSRQELPAAPYVEQLHFLGNIGKFTFIQEKDFDIPMHSFSKPVANQNTPKNVIYHNYLSKEEIIRELNRMGGFGLVWSEDPYWQEYLKVSNPFKLATYLAANIPVVVPRYLSSAAIIEENHLGLVVDSIEEAVARIRSMSAEEYQTMQASICQFSRLLRQGAFTKKLLIDAVHLANRKSINKKITLPPRFNIQVKNIDETLRYVTQHRASVARFGDGEIDLIHGKSIPYQDYDEQLSNRLKSLLFRQSDEQLVVCLSDVFQNLDRYNDYAQQFWRGNFAHYAPFYESLGRMNHWFGSTFISRPYIDLQDKTTASNSFEQLKELWHNKDILIVEGALSQSGMGNDLFAQAKSIQRIICPSKNAYSKYDEIFAKIQQHAQGKLVLLMLGPTAKVLVEDLTKLNIQAIDLGHIDSEYEWFLMGATYKVKFNHKHTAEHNFDENIELQLDETYLAQIVEKIG